MKKGPYDYLRDYSYPFVRDALFVLVNDVFDGDDRLNENMDLRGWAVLYPRSEEDAELLKSVLSNHDVKFEEYGDAVKFKYGQSSRIDDTVRQMANDLSLRTANEILIKAKENVKTGGPRHKPDVVDKQKALNQLKDMITNVDEVRSGDTHRGYFYLYFPADKIDLADELLQKLDIYAEKHVSHRDGKETMVLRYPATMVPGYFSEVYGELQDALHARKAKGDFEQGIDEVDDREAARNREELELRRQEAFAKLATIVQAVRRAKYEDVDIQYYYFYLPFKDIEEAKQLMQEYVGIAPEMHVSHAGGVQATVLRYEIDKESSFMDRIELLKKDLNAAIKKRQAVEKLKKMIIHVGTGYDDQVGGKCLHFFLGDDADDELCAKAQALFAECGMQVKIRPTFRMPIKGPGIFGRTKPRKSLIYPVDKITSEDMKVIVDIMGAYPNGLGANQLKGDGRSNR
ncbi:MAG: hypothetical protein J5613_04900 [Alphaproteobacteria bacterium]|nr:hypothetical protein [Alphaproteobacteria bacterium]